MKSIELINRLTPVIVLKVWYTHISVPYQTYININDISFFIKKNYTEDVSLMSNSDEILQMIDRIRDPISSMSKQNQCHTMKHIKNLTKLSLIYHGDDMDIEA